MSASHAEAKPPVAQAGNVRSLSLVTDRRTVEKERERSWQPDAPPQLQVSTAWVRSSQLLGRRHPKVEISPSKLAVDAGYDSDQEADGTYMSTHDEAPGPDAVAPPSPGSPEYWATNRDANGIPMLPAFGKLELVSPRATSPKWSASPSKLRMGRPRDSVSGRGSSRSEGGAAALGFEVVPVGSLSAAPSPSSRLPQGRPRFGSKGDVIGCGGGRIDFGCGSSMSDAAWGAAPGADAAAPSPPFHRPPTSPQVVSTSAAATSPLSVAPSVLVSGSSQSYAESATDKGPLRAFPLSQPLSGTPPRALLLPQHLEDGASSPEPPEERIHQPTRKPSVTPRDALPRPTVASSDSDEEVRRLRVPGGDEYLRAAAPRDRCATVTRSVCDRYTTVTCPMRLSWR